MQVRIPDDQGEMIKTLATTHNRSVPKEVATALAEYIARHVEEFKTGPNLSSAPKRTLRGKR